MSGVYIRGMEMPTSCFYCPFRRKVNPDDIMCIVTREVFEETFAGTIEHRNRGNCPIIPVPDHGELIERKRLNDVCYTHFEDFMEGKIDGKTALLNIEKEIKAAPTIIPADKEGEGHNG